ncbi:C-lectin, putative [Bodo saltans]|uniref:C-lectin, putative n=1 Tax=Bodo saltans TaxID=75058 RepID=A0A0S4JF80_BODSA|nr:C-lectin, putative [Bodo saltans]|eukprot:CUG87810.1 C-lectin, putative [Bodo saltans]
MCDHSLLSGHHSSRSNRRLHHQGTAHTSVRTTGDDSAASLAAPVATLLSSQHRCGRRSSSQSSTHQHALISSLAMFLIMASLGMIESSRALEEGGSCPAGWTTFTTIDPTQRNTNGSTLATVQRCATTRLEKLPGVDTEFFCSNILRLDTGITSITATTFAVREASDVSIATSLAQIAFASSSTITAVFLGGVYSVGQLAWFDGVTPETSGTTGSFANWSSTGPASGASGCVVVQRDYSWNTVPCSGTLLPFLCASDVVPPSTPSPSPAPTTAAPSTTTAVPGGPYASTPDVAHPAPACPTGWSPSGNTSDATKCYRMVYLSTPTPQQTAADYCASLHRNAALSSVLTPSEDAYVAQVIRTSATSTTGYLAYVGGLYMDNGNLGVWSEDSIWYPDWTGASSPSWPTATNPTYYTNWAAGEPSVSFGCIAVNSSSGQWYGVSCQDSFPFVCAFLNDGVTAAPSTTAPPSTQITTSSPITTPSPTALSTVSCPTGWSNVTGSRLCIRALTSAASAADLESTCNALTAGLFPSKVLPTGVSAFVHAASPMNSSLNSAIASVLQSGGFPLATIGVSFVENGAYRRTVPIEGPSHRCQCLCSRGISHEQQPQQCYCIRSSIRWFSVGHHRSVVC